MTGALESSGRKKTIGSSLEAVPVVYIDRCELLRSGIDGVDMAEISITSGLVISHQARRRRTPSRCATCRAWRWWSRRPSDRGLRKCARSWRYTDDVGSDPEFPDVSARDAAALRELRALGRL